MFKPREIIESYQIKVEALQQDKIKAANKIAALKQQLAAAEWQAIKATAATIQLNKKLADAKKDAERYRFLRDDTLSMPDGQRDINAVRFSAAFSEDQVDETLFGVDLDRFLDAAISAQKEKS